MSETPKTILLVSSSPRELDGLRRNSAALGEFTVRWAANVWDADDILKTNNVGAMLLDFELEDARASEFCRALRRRGVSLPIIMVSGSKAAADVVVSLDAGADDYVRKSVGGKELAARIRAQIRRYQKTLSKRITVGRFDFDAYQRVLCDKERGVRVHLTEKEARCLQYLAGRSDRFATRQELYREIWGHQHAINTHTLNTHIYRLRMKIEADPRHPTILLSEGSGYRLVP